jgi:serine/threonine protein kinase
LLRPSDKTSALFEGEATVWISLEKHPYIVRAYQVERFNSLPYVITEYVRGPEGMEGDLRGWLGHPRMTLPVAVTMALQIAQGMQHAVRKVPNLVHRDLKPGNILVNGDGKAMVTDFGLVNSAEAGAGTPAYMSPEQWREDALDVRSDIYAYGCILFEMFTGHRLFLALAERDWESAHLESKPTALTDLVPDLPREIDQYIRRCLEKDAGARPQNWDEVVTFFAEWYHRLTGKAVVLDFSSLAFDVAELIIASYSLSNLKQYEAVLLVCDRARAIDPNDTDILYRKGHAFERLKRYEEAIQTYEQALAINPNDAEFWKCKGYLLYDLERYDEALCACDEAIVVDPENDDNWYTKGCMLLELERYEEAIEAFDQVLDIYPDHMGAQNDRQSALDALKAAG